MKQKGRLSLAARIRTLGMGAVLTVASLAALIPTTAGATASTTWDIQAGNMSFVEPVQEITAFYPMKVVVHPQDVVKFKAVGPHTVTFNGPPIPALAYCDPTLFAGDTLTPAQSFGAPLSSGPFGFGGGPCGPPNPAAPTTYTLKIGTTAAGASGTTYQFSCRLHRDMLGSITVLPAGTPLPSDNARNQLRAKRAMALDLKLGRRVLARANDEVEDNRVAAGVGATSVQGHGGISVLRFAPGTIEINVGESVTWTNLDINAPHTVTFGVETPPPPGTPLPPGFMPDANRTLSAPGQTANSGVLWSQQLVDYLNLGGLLAGIGLTVADRVTMTFTGPGVYRYTCALHDDLGMLGTVIVKAGD
jgi:plastocyanin